MELLSQEEIKMYRSRIFENKLEKPNITLSLILAYSIVSIFFIICFMFAMTVSCISDSTRPIEACRDSISGQTLSFIIQKLWQI